MWPRPLVDRLDAESPTVGAPLRGRTGQPCRARARGRDHRSHAGEMNAVLRIGEPLDLRRPRRGQRNDEMVRCAAAEQQVAPVSDDRDEVPVRVGEQIHTVGGAGTPPPRQGAVHRRCPRRGPDFPTQACRIGKDSPHNDRRHSFAHLCPVTADGAAEPGALPPRGRCRAARAGPSRRRRPSRSRRARPALPRVRPAVTAPCSVPISVSGRGPVCRIRPTGPGGPTAVARPGPARVRSGRQHGAHTRHPRPSAAGDFSLRAPTRVWGVVIDDRPAQCRTTNLARSGPA